MKKIIYVTAIIVVLTKVSSGYAWELPTWGQIKTWFTPTYFKKGSITTIYGTDVANTEMKQPVMKQSRPVLKGNLLMQQERPVLKENILYKSLYRKAIPQYLEGTDATAERRQANIAAQKRAEESRAEFQKTWNTPEFNNQARSNYLMGRDVSSFEKERREIARRAEFERGLRERAKE